MRKSEASIILVHHNTPEITLNCIRSIHRNTRCSYEILVADNSTEQEKQLPDTPGIQKFTIENHGFGAACNFCAAYAKGDFLIFLNTDTLVHPFAIDRCIKYLKFHPKAGAAGGKLVSANGEFDPASRRGLPTPFASLCYFTGLDRKFPQNKKIAAYRLLYLSENRLCHPEVLSGAFMVLRAEAFHQIKGFDEDFFLYGEDIDLCLRLKKSGWDLTYLPSAVVTHLKGASGFHSGNPKVIREFYRSMSLFYEKHFLKKYGILGSMAVNAGIRLLYFRAICKAKQKRKPI